MGVWHTGEIDLEPLSSLGQGSMAGFLNIEFVGIGDDWLKARMPVDERSRQPFGRVHGGAWVALAETVGSVAGLL